MKLLTINIMTIIALLVIGNSAMAENKCAESCSGTTNVTQNCDCPEAATKTVYMTFKQQKKISDLEAEIARLKEQLAKQYEFVPEPEVKVVEKEVSRKNSVSLLLPYSPTKLKVTQPQPGRYTSETDYQLDLGLMYQRDLTEAFRGTVGVTLNGTFMLGVGLNF